MAPASYLSLLTDHEPDTPGHECALAILYAFKTLHLVHFLTYPSSQDSTFKFMPHDLSDIIRNVPSFATALRLFPNRSNFRDVPAFIHTFFQDQQVASNPFDKRQDSQRSSYNEHPTNFGSTSLFVFTYSPLVNGFGDPSPEIPPRSSQAARSLISAALQHHASLSTKVTNGDDPDLQPTNIILGALPPADMIFNYHCSAFPMATLPTTEQLHGNTTYAMHPATTLAVNFVICRDISPNYLQEIDIPAGNHQYSSDKSHFIPLSTNTYNYSIDFLPDHEYLLFRVVKTLDVIDPQRVLPQTPEPSNVLIFQGTHSENPSYTSGSQVELPIPKEGAHTFPIIYDSDNLPIIFDHRNGNVEPYTSTTTYQVITTKRGSDNVYRAWALPHLQDALQKPADQIKHNRFSFFWQQHNHPEYPYTNKTPELLLNVIPVVLTRRSSLLPENNPGIEPATPNPENSDSSTEIDETEHETSAIPENSPISDTPAPFIDTSQQNPTENPSNPLQRLSRAVGQILTPKTPLSDTADQTQPPTAEIVPKTPTSRPNAPLPPKRSETHPTFAYPPRQETFFDDDDQDDEQEDDNGPPQIPLGSPDALTSSTRTDFTYPPIEDLTRTLLKYAKTANLRKLNYPSDLLQRRRQFNAFMDNLQIVCNISPWTRNVFDLWPKQISYSHPCIGTALYNLIFTNISDPCQKHIIDCPPDARTAILTLRRHQEVATSYLNRIRTLTRDCYHAGIPNTDADIIKRTIRGGSNHHFYAASYQRFDADIRRAELNDEELPTFAELESHLLNIDDSRGLTLPSQNQRNYNQHANSARQPFSNQSSRPRQGTTRVFTPRQQHAFSSMMRPYTASNNRPPHRPNNRGPNQAPAPPRQHNNNDRRSTPQQSRPFQQQNRGSRPPLRPISSNNGNQRRPPNNTPAVRRNLTHPMLQILYAITVVDLATMLIDA
ncbi:hypothetical protein MHU86_23021 [Fragilaria crotonensis]|nr:hypothetical protein MHU86_23021 [Fragilaria crotonensis]